MSEENNFPRFIRFIPTKNKSYKEEFVPLKGREVPPNEKPTIHNQQGEHEYQNTCYREELPLSQSNPIYYNAFDVVNHLEKLNEIENKRYQKRSI